MSQEGYQASAPGREAFTAPSLDQGSSSNTAIQFNSQQSQSGFQYGTSTGQNAFSGPENESDDPPVKYLCGDCDREVKLRKNDPIRCAECGYRVLYKQRTTRCVSSRETWSISLTALTG